MISSPHRRSRSGLWFAACTIISLLLLLASQTDPALTLQNISARALDPIRQTIGGICERGVEQSHDALAA